MNDLLKPAAGRELDAEVALQVMGWTKHRNDRPATDVEASKLDWEYWWVPQDRDGSIHHRKTLPRYSDCIEDAWRIVEQMDRLGYCWAIRKNDEEGESIQATFWLPGVESPNGRSAGAASAAEAISRAALATIRWARSRARWD